MIIVIIKIIVLKREQDYAKIYSMYSDIFQRYLHIIAK